MGVGVVRPAEQLFLGRGPLDHEKRFVEFCEYELLTGGPDPHMAAAVEIGRPLPRAEALWFVHLYVAFYNVPSAETVWRHWPHDEARADTSGFQGWLVENWWKLAVRRERRTVNSPTKMHRCCAAFFEQEVPGELEALPSSAGFEGLWGFATSLPHVGRYAATKLTEAWYRLGETPHECPDIRAAGGWSPRSTLLLLFGEGDPRDDSPQAVRQAESLAAELRRELGQQRSVHLSPFQLEVLLCEYKESAVTRRQYPGRSLDSELGYERAIREQWPGGGPSLHMAARRALAPSWALGEAQGWAGVRPELGHVLSRFGYTWSDKIYDYRATEDLGNPVRRFA